MSCSSRRSSHIDVNKSCEFFNICSPDNCDRQIINAQAGATGSKCVENTLFHHSCVFSLSLFSCISFFFFLFFSSLPCRNRIRSLNASLSACTSKRKRKGKQEGRGGRGRPTDKRRGATESKNRGGKTSRWQRRKNTGNRKHDQD